MNPSIIFLDLDFTLLRTNKTISERTIKILAKCKENGIKIAFATSRGYQNIEQFKKQINPEIIICNAGANIFYNNNLINTEILNIEETKEIFFETYKVLGNNAEITCDTNKGLYWNRKENKSENYMPDALYDNFFNFNESTYKICIQTDNNKKINEIIKNTKNKRIEATKFSDIPWFKISSKNASKEKAILFISNYLNIDTKNTFAFGDDFSDLKMLQTCGKGIAMSNAIPEIKAVANEITLSNDEDGVAYYLENNIIFK